MAVAKLKTTVTLTATVNVNLEDFPGKDPVEIQAEFDQSNLDDPQLLSLYPDFQTEVKSEWVTE